MKKFLTVLVLIFAALGVLFVILLFIPDDEEDSDDTQGTEIVAQEDGSVAEIPADDAQPADTGSAAVVEEETDEEEQTATADAQEAVEPETVAEQEDESETVEANVTEPDDTASSDADVQAQADGGNTVQVDIPASEKTGKSVKFKTLTLDEKQVTQDIFAGYDITVVHIWGTYCGPCIAEMGDYAKWYDELPDNVNLVGLICDVYDGINNNVKDAERILGDAGAGFTNLRSSDDLYNVLEAIQFVPSSFFVDSDGQIIGEIMDGAHFDDTKKRLESYLK